MKDRIQKLTVEAEKNSKKEKIHNLFKGKKKHDNLRKVTKEDIGF